jgi:hypothetical protein
VILWVQLERVSFGDLGDRCVLVGVGPYCLPKTRGGPFTQHLVYISVYELTHTKFHTTALWYPAK